MSFKFSRRSLDNLKGVHPDLARVMHRAISISDLDFMIVEGMRSLETQKRYVEVGASKTLNSRHLTGHAVDVAVMVDGKVRWDWPLYQRLAKTIKKAAKEEGVPVEWGGDWAKFPDGPHWQLPRKEYPK